VLLDGIVWYQEIRQGNFSGVRNVHIDENEIFLPIQIEQAACQNFFRFLSDVDIEMKL